MSEMITSVDRLSPDLPSDFSLSQNFPNPFNPTTSITFDVPRRSSLRLAVYDVLGRKVMTLSEGVYEAGSYSVNADFSRHASGIYIYRLEAGSFIQVRKLVVAK